MYHPGPVDMGSMRKKYLSSSHSLILTLSSRSDRVNTWALIRPSGIKVIEGQGQLPDGVKEFIQGTIQIPKVRE